MKKSTSFAFQWFCLNEYAGLWVDSFLCFWEWGFSLHFPLPILRWIGVILKEWGGWCRRETDLQQRKLFWFLSHFLFYVFVGIVNKLSCSGFESAESACQGIIMEKSALLLDSNYNHIAVFIVSGSHLHLFNLSKLGSHKTPMN